MGAGAPKIFAKVDNLRQDIKLPQIQGCFKTEWSDGGAREMSVGEVRGDACVRCAGFHKISFHKVGL